MSLNLGIRHVQRGPLSGGSRRIRIVQNCSDSGWDYDANSLKKLAPQAGFVPSATSEASGAKPRTGLGRQRPKRKEIRSPAWTTFDPGSSVKRREHVAPSTLRFLAIDAPEVVLGPRLHILK